MRFIGKDPNIIDAYYTATAEGAITAGKPVIVEADGDVAQVSGSTNTTPSPGTPEVFESGATNYFAIAYDSNAGKMVVAYQDGDNSNYGTAVVGTVSGTSITFGTPVVFESATALHIDMAYDANAQKVVIVYRDAGNGDDGTAIVGTVSGTSISFGSASVYNTQRSSHNAIAYDANAQKLVIAYQKPGNGEGMAIVGTVSGTSISFGSAAEFYNDNSEDMVCVYEENAQKVVIAYRNENNYGSAVVATVSGTDVSFGTPAVFESATSYYISLAYDSNAQKIVVAYRDAGNSDHGTAIVGTVSGTSISFGTAAVFNSASTDYLSAAYDTLVQGTVITYQDQGNSFKGTAIVGTVSGTSISFGTAGVFEDGSTAYGVVGYEPTAQKSVAAYRDNGNSSYGTAVVITAKNIITNLTSENYIGIAADTYADNEDSTIGIVGCIDRNQTSLTAGQQYFVQTDGTLATTADDPSVLAGTAISATELVVKE